MAGPRPPADNSHLFEDPAAEADHWERIADRAWRQMGYLPPDTPEHAAALQRFENASAKANACRAKAVRGEPEPAF